MAFDRSAGTHPKYRSAEHKRRRAKLVEQLQREGFLLCTAPRCLLPTRTITNPNGRARDGLHLGHNPDGVTYAGPQHNACNVTEAAVRARAMQGAQPPSTPTIRPFTSARAWGHHPPPSPR